MRLTRKKAIELCIEMWTWLAETGKHKHQWPGWKKYGDINLNCWFCGYHFQQLNRKGENGTVGKCKHCPLWQKYRCLCGKTMYGEWTSALTSRARKKYAKLFLEQIKAL